APPAVHRGRIRLLVDEPVSQDEHLPLALSERLERDRESLAAECALDAFLRQRLVAGDEVAEDGVLLVTDRLVEARRGPRGGAHLARLLDRQRRLVRNLVEGRLASELHPAGALGP